MDIGRSIRRLFSPGYHRTQSQLRQANETLPKGAPSLTASGKEPVGPNRYEAMTKKERKNASPDYPVQYHIPVEVRERGLFKKKGRMEPTGEPASLITGPGLLPPEHRVPGRFDYSTIPDVTVSPVDKVTQSPILSRGFDRTYAANRGVPADRVTGFPKLPPLRNGPFKVEASFNATHPPPEIPTAAEGRRMSLDSFGYPRMNDD